MILKIIYDAKNRWSHGKTNISLCNFVFNAISNTTKDIMLGGKIAFVSKCQIFFWVTKCPIRCKFSVKKQHKKLSKYSWNYSQIH